MSDSLKQNREPLSREKRSFFKKKPVDFVETIVEKNDHDLSTDEMHTLKLKLKKAARRERLRDLMILLSILFALGIALFIALYLSGMI